MKVLITGVNGFIGQHLTRALINKNYSVIGIGRSKTSFIPEIKYYSGSVLDKKIIIKAIKNVDAVVHLAALTAHQDIVDNKFKALEINFFGTKNLLDAFVTTKSAKKFLYASTGKVYGKIKNLPISEDHQAAPLNILGKSKLITEKLIDFYSSSKKKFIIFRIFNVFGPGQANNFLIPTILNQLDSNKNEIVLGDIEAKRDYIYIDDVINAFVLALEKKNLTGISIYNICTGVGTSAATIIKMISKIKKMALSIKSNSSLFRQDEMGEEYGSYALAKREFNWTPKLTLAEGINKLLK
ncbi:GDP-mannose 4,6-dehydratase [Candidatus Roizmanbacteria bacterium]|nr:GDP-mannose 4,6-dehydratase [Candidatus Roizmanbacteria bacterium]